MSESDLTVQSLLARGMFSAEAVRLPAQRRADGLDLEARWGPTGESTIGKTSMEESPLRLMPCFEGGRAFEDVCGSGQAVGEEVGSGTLEAECWLVGAMTKVSRLAGRER